VKVIWTPEAEQERSDVVDYIAADNPRAAAKMDELFDLAVARLAKRPNVGRPGKIPGTRELIPHESYRLLYEVADDTVWVLALVHTSRQWPPMQE
jgi:toxin ParE1/3/4